jgi:hypothetical protein
MLKGVPHVPFNCLCSCPNGQKHFVENLTLILWIKPSFSCIKRVPHVNIFIKKLNLTQWRSFKKTKQWCSGCIWSPAHPQLHGE